MEFEPLSESMIRSLHQAVTEILPHVRRFRQTLHQIPEASMEENKTSRLIQTEFTDVGIPFEGGLAGTGIAADIDTGRNGGYVMLRADMDALPIQENSGAPYHSQHDGYSHACGHDGHVAVVTGAARVLTAVQSELRGRIRFIFQPGEEVSRGAREMIEAGVLAGRRPDAILSLHSWPGLETGHVACRNGAMMAASDAFEVEVTGRGGHGARPHLASNPLNALVPIAERFMRMDTEHRVISPCMLHVGDKYNVIADKGLLSGSLRTLDEETREQTMQEMRGAADSLAAGEDCAAKLSFESGCPVVHTDSELYRLFAESAKCLLGRECVHELDHPSMGSEDFGFYLEHAPGLMFRLGMGCETAELHNSAFDFNDDALHNGVLLLAALAVSVCREKQ